MSVFGKLGVINTNLMANAAYDGLERTNNLLNTHQSRIATLKKVNNAADDPAGYIHATGMKIDINGMGVAENNIASAQNMIGIANQGATSIKDLLMEMRNKALESMDGSKTTQQRAAIQDQVAQFINEIQDTVGQTTWNGENLLDGNAAFNFQTGPERGNVTDMAIDLNFRLGLKQANLANGLKSGDIYFSGTSVADSGKPLVTSADSVIDADWTVEFTGDTSYKVSYTTAEGVTYDYASTYYLTSGQQFTGRGVSLDGLRLASGVVEADFAEGDVISFSTTKTVRGDNYGLEWDVENDDNYGMALTSMVVASGGTGLTGLAKAGDLIEFEVQVTDGATLNSGATSAALQIRTRVDNGDGTGWGDWTDWENTKHINASGSVTFDSTDHHATGLELKFSANDVLTEGDVFKGKVQTSQAGHVTSGSVNVDGLTGYGGINLSTENGAKASLLKLDKALGKVDTELGDMGAMTRRLDIKSELLAGRKSQVGAAVSRIEDADLIYEQMEVAKLNILQQANMSLLAQAQQAPRMVLGIMGMGG